jgi:hypothetical protein
MLRRLKVAGKVWRLLEEFESCWWVLRSSKLSRKASK